MYLYFSIGNGQPREPALCQLYRHTCCWQVDYGDGTATATFAASGRVAPVPDWAGAAAAAAFGEDRRGCDGAVLEHVYQAVGTYTARVRVTAMQQSAGGRYDELVAATRVNATVRRRTLAQVTEGRLKMRDMNSRHQFARVEIAGQENAGPTYRSGKCRT